MPNDEVSPKPELLTRELVIFRYFVIGHSFELRHSDFGFAAATICLRLVNSGS
jgi:hypothetical protein